MRDVSGIHLSRVSRAQAAERLREMPNCVLRCMLAELEVELHHEHLRLLADQREWHEVTQCLSDVEGRLTVARQRANARERRRRRAEAMVAAATRRRAELEAAVAGVQEELGHMTLDASHVAAEELIDEPSHSTRRVRRELR